MTATDTNVYMAKLEAQARKTAGSYKVDNTRARVTERVVTNGLGYTPDVHFSRLSDSYRSLGNHLQSMDSATGQDPQFYDPMNLLQGIRNNLDYLGPEIKAYKLDWVYRLLEDAPTVAEVVNGSLRNVKDLRKAHETVGRMAQLKTELDQCAPDDKATAFASQDSVDYAWRMRELGIRRGQMTSLMRIVNESSESHLLPKYKPKNLIYHSSTIEKLPVTDFINELGDKNTLFDLLGRSPRFISSMEESHRFNEVFDKDPRMRPYLIDHEPRRRDH